MAIKALLFPLVPLAFLIGSVCPNQSKPAQQQQIAVMPQDALLFLADLAAELMVNRSTIVVADQQQVEAAKLRAALFRIVPADVEKKKFCAVAINTEYLNKFADGMQRFLASGIGAGIQAQLGSPNGTKQLCPVIENYSYLYIYKTGLQLSKQLASTNANQSAVLGIPRSEYARLEQAMDAGVARQLALLKSRGVVGNLAESVAKYNDIKIAASPISSNGNASVEADAENWPELIALLAQKEASNQQDRIKWSEFAQAKNDTFGTFKDVRVQSAIFYSNQQQIIAHNQAADQGQISYRLGINHFADYCIQYIFDDNCMSRSRYIREFDGSPLFGDPPSSGTSVIPSTGTVVTNNEQPRSQMLRQLQQQKLQQQMASSSRRRKRQASGFQDSVDGNATLPASIDWRNFNGTNYVTDVVDKNKILDDLYGDAEHCSKTSYAFAAASTLETYVAFRSADRRLRRFSAKQCMDCAVSYGANSLGRCTGGDPEICFQYMIDGSGLNNRTSGIEEWTSYPLQATDTCQYNASSTTVANIRDWDVLGDANFDGLTGEEGMKTVLATHGPVTAFFVQTDKFYMYKSGVYFEPLCSAGTGALFVTVIGYGTDEATGMDYWLIKNHWGKDWGENGYARVARNMGNNCLISNWVNYPLF